jgi:hypothetical protein
VKEYLYLKYKKTRVCDMMEGGREGEEIIKKEISCMKSLST